MLRRIRGSVAPCSRLFYIFGRGDLSFLRVEDRENALEKK